MRMLASVVLVAAVQAAQSYPPPFPRPGASKLLDNEQVQVWKVEWPKGQPTALHRHPYAMTGQYYAPGDRLITAVDGSKRPVSTKAGGIVWQLKGLTHIEEGTSDPPLRAVMIELKQEAPSGHVDTGTVAPFTSSGAMPLLDNERVTVWDYTPPPGPVTHRHAHDAVGVWIDGAAAPHVVWIARGTTHTGDMAGATHATIFELK